MGQKVNPIGLRLGVTKNWASIWSGDKKNYIEIVYRDLRIREYVVNRLSKLGYIVGQCVIRRINHQLLVNIQVLTTKNNNLRVTPLGPTATLSTPAPSEASKGNGPATLHHSKNNSHVAAKTSNPQNSQAAANQRLQTNKLRRRFIKTTQSIDVNSSAKIRLAGGAACALFTSSQAIKLVLQKYPSVRQKTRITRFSSVLNQPSQNEPEQDTEISSNRRVYKESRSYKRDNLAYGQATSVETRALRARSPRPAAARAGYSNPALWTVLENRSGIQARDLNWGSLLSQRQKFNVASLLTLDKLKSCTFNNLRGLSKKQRKQAIIYLITQQLEIFEGLLAEIRKNRVALPENIKKRQPKKYPEATAKGRVAVWLRSHTPGSSWPGESPFGSAGYLNSLKNIAGDTLLEPTALTKESKKIYLTTTPTSFPKESGPVKITPKTSQESSVWSFLDIGTPISRDSSKNEANGFGFEKQGAATFNLRLPQRTTTLGQKISPIKVKLSNARLFNQPYIAQGLANYIAKTISKRKSVSFALKPIMKLIEEPFESKTNKLNNMGLRVKYSGRINGVEMARSSQIQIGRVPLQSIDVRIDYAIARVYTIFGVIGVKVWINKNNK